MERKNNDYVRRFFQKILPLLLTFLLFSVFLSVMAADGAELDRGVIRVGYPIQPGLSEIDQDGHYAGYTYEYLQELAQYTGWEYEFVQLTGTQNEILSKMYEMLQKGELDIMGATTYSPELDELYDYPAGSYGSVFMTLEVLQDNTAINGANYKTLENIRVAVLEHAEKSIAALNKFCEDNRIRATLVPCKNDAELLRTLRERRADALLSNDVSIMEETRVVVRFNPKPFYFAVTNGNYQLVSRLNSAMMMLDDSDPYFETALYQKYFANRNQTLLFTDDEQAYLDRAPDLRVAVTRERLPLEHMEQGGAAQGISVDLLKIIAKETGLRFESVPVDSVEGALEALRLKKVDLALGIVYDYNTSRANHVSLTKPYLSAQVVMAAQKGLNPYQLEGKRLALPSGSGYDSGFRGDVTYYDSILECLRAVNEGTADYCYGNGYSVEYYCNLYRYQNLTLIPQSRQINQYCIGVARPADPLLITVLNKTIRSIPQGDLQAMIYENSAPPDKGISIRDVIEENPLETVILFSGMAVFVLLLLMFFALVQSRARKRTQVENDRYQLLAEMSGDYLFEYDFSADQLTMTEKTVQFFGGQRVVEQFYKRLSAAQNEYTGWITGLIDSIQSKKSITLERQVTVPDGRTLWLRVTVAAIDGANGRVSYVIGKVADIQEEKMEKDALALKAQTDGLTGLYHGTAARVLIESALRDSAFSASGALLMMDIDKFKDINDRFGHYTGDRVLQDVSRILKTVFRTKCIIGRLGGDEFLVYMQDASDGKTVAERCRALQGALNEQAREWPTAATISIGAALVRGPIGYDVLYQSADRYLYEAKAAGRDSFYIGDGEEAADGN